MGSITGTFLMLQSLPQSDLHLLCCLVLHAQQQHSSNTSPPVISEQVLVVHEETPLSLSIRYNL